TIPLLNLKRQQAGIQEELQAAMNAIIGNTAYIGGKAVQQFEENFARFCGAEYCIGVGNGTDALALILQALDLPAGSEVITTPMTFIATAEAISRSGLTPVFADIEPDSYNLDAGQVERKITSKTRAVMAVHLYGQPASLAALQQVADAN